MSNFLFLKFSELVASPRLLSKPVAPSAPAFAQSQAGAFFIAALPCLNKDFVRINQVPKRLAVIREWKSRPEYLAAMQKIEEDGMREIRDPVPTGCSKREWEKRIIAWKKLIRQLVQSTPPEKNLENGVVSHDEPPTKNLGTGVASATGYESQAQALTVVTKDDTVCAVSNSCKQKN